VGSLHEGSGYWAAPGKLTPVRGLPSARIRLGSANIALSSQQGANNMSRPPGSILLLDDPIRSLDDYIEGGGAQGLSAALERAPEDVIEEVRLSGLRGRGGAGFPTGIIGKSLKHFQINWWLDGVKGSGRSIHIPLPFK
jgi:hypothetical protein